MISLQDVRLRVTSGFTVPQPTNNNCITDVAGVTVGHATDESAQSGVTVLRCEQRMTAAVDIRGGAPGSRETDVLAPGNLVEQIDAVVLTGGSVFGLAAADGVTSALARSGEGLRLHRDAPVVPIVPAAVLYDLENPGDKTWTEAPPYQSLGKAALLGATAPAALGSLGAGRGARAGSLPGGIGSASIRLDNGTMVGALVAVNSVGSVVLPNGETYYAWPYEIGDEFGGQPAPGKPDLVAPIPPFSRLHAQLHPRTATTLAIIATDLDLGRSDCRRIAVMAQDGMARAIRPAHSPLDGDIVFALSNGANAAPADLVQRAIAVTEVGSAAADCLARAIARGVYTARGQAEV